MKKLFALLLCILTLASCHAVLADGSYSAWDGECISRQVSLYSEMSTRSKRIRYIKNGEAFDITEKSPDGNWAHVVHTDEKGNTATGWVDVNYIVENPTHIVLRNNNGVYAYAAPQYTNKRVGTVNRYDRFTVIATVGNYYLVSFRCAVAYLPKNADYWVEENLAGLLSGSGMAYKTTSAKTQVLAYPQKNGGAVATYGKNTPVTVYYTTGNYAAIGYNRVLAFIALSDLVKVTE